MIAPMLKLYGMTKSRALRCIWMLYELDVQFEQVRVSPESADFPMDVNPNRKIPALVDGETVMWESMAINLYLAQTRTTPLSPRGRAELGDALKWTLWAQSELEEFFNKTASLDEVSAEWMQKTFGVLEATLGKHTYLIDDRFTVADLNVSAIFFGPVLSRVSLENFPLTKQWRQACWARPACARALREVLDPAFA
jgi:glutathione S-transferase